MGTFVSGIMIMSTGSFAIMDFSEKRAFSWCYSDGLLQVSSDYGENMPAIQVMHDITTEDRSIIPILHANFVQTWMQLQPSFEMTKQQL